MFKNIKIYERNAVLYFDLSVSESFLKALKNEEFEKELNLKGEAFLNTLNQGKNYKRLRFSSGLKTEAKDFLEQNAKKLLLSYFLQGNKAFKKAFCKQSEELSVKHFANILLKQNNGLKKSTQELLKYAVSFCSKFFKERSIKSIDKNDILEFYELLEKKEFQKGSIKIYINVLKRIFDCALDCGVIIKNPVFNKKYSKCDLELDKLEPFNEEEFFTLLKQKGDIGLYLKIALLSGARTGEILALKFGDFDFEKKKIHISKAVSKAHKGLHTPKTLSSNRIIDLLPSLSFFIEEEKARRKAKNEDFIFTKPKGKMILNFQQSHLNTQYKALLQSLGIKHRRIYNTRHSFASLMLSKNEPIVWVSFMLGHKDTSITLKTYTKFIPLKTMNYAAFISETLKKQEEVFAVLSN